MPDGADPLCALALVPASERPSAIATSSRPSDAARDPAGAGFPRRVQRESTPRHVRQPPVRLPTAQLVDSRLGEYRWLVGAPARGATSYHGVPCLLGR